MKPAYKRVLLKISGQSLAGERGWGIDSKTIQITAREIVELAALGVELGAVCGGGNIIRGITASAEGINRTAADYMGMLGGVINALALQDALEKCGAETRLLSAIEIKQVAEPELETPSSPRTPARRCARWRSAPRYC
jgi:uridylate kinase